MSSNKLKYFHVTQDAIVAANNQRDAIAIARGRRGVSGRLLGDASNATRISAARAKEATDESSNTKTKTLTA